MLVLSSLAVHAVATRLGDGQSRLSKRARRRGPARRRASVRAQRGWARAGGGSPSRPPPQGRQLFLRRELPPERDPPERDPPERDPPERDPLERRLGLARWSEGISSRTTSLVSTGICFSRKLAIPASWRRYSLASFSASRSPSSSASVSIAT